MKKGIIFLLAIGLVSSCALAQPLSVPQGFKYQAVARDAAGKPYTLTDLRLTVTLKDAALPGTIYYVEEHAVKTTELGLINLVIGEGTPINGTFSSIPWSGEKISLALAISLDDGITWRPLGESPLLAVPYALFAASAASANGSFITDRDGLTRVDTEDPASPGQVRIRLAGEPAAVFTPASGYNRLEFLGDAHNTVVGLEAMPVNTGIQNTALGWRALRSGEEAANNTAIGSQAMLFSKNGVDNTAVGINAMVLSVHGDRNVAIGSNALYSNQASDNLAIGKDALYQTTDGSMNTAVGSACMFSNTTGYSNTAVGYFSLYHISTGHRNTALGAEALVYTGIGAYNTAIGALSMTGNTDGQGNTAVGSNTLHTNSLGSGNTALGGNALYSSTNGDYNTAVGFDALRQNGKGGHNVAVGTGALHGNHDVSAQVAVGDSALFATTTGYTNTAIGYGTLQANRSGFGNVALGYLALHDPGQSSFNTALGREAGPSGEYSNTTAIGAGARTTKSNQVVIGNTSTTQIGGYTNWSNLSDSRYKLDVAEDVPGLAFIRRLHPVTYRLDIPGLARDLGENRLALSHEGGTDTKAAELLAQLQTQKADVRYSGFIAQEVEAAANEIRYTFSGIEKPEDRQGMYALRYAEFVVPLVKAIQEQQAQIEALQAENASLRNMAEDINRLKTAWEEFQKNR